MILRKIFGDKIHPKVYDVILKITIIAYYLPAGYLLINIFLDNGYVFDFTGVIINVFYVISLIWTVGTIITVLKFWKRTFRIGKEKASCFSCLVDTKKIFEECKRELRIHREIELLQGYRIQVPMTAGILKPCVFLPVDDMEEEQLKMCLYHELIHYKNHDIFWNYISCLMVCIHWYCPWIRVVFQKIDEWSEVICDLSAINYVGSTKRYFTTIFEMSQKSQGIKAYMTACLFENQDSLEHRIYYAMMYRKQKEVKYASVIAMTALFCGLSVTATYAMSKEYQKIYTRWVQETEIEIEEPDNEEEEEVLYEEKTGILENDKREVIKKIKLEETNAMILETYVKAGERLRYEELNPKQDENIEIFIAGQKKFKGIKVGIVDSKNKTRYIQDKRNDQIRYKFKIEKEEKYDVFIEVEDKKKVKIVGMIDIDD
nr:M56 family metallopeptidase [uncultured Anaerostipes sp.]